VSEYEGTRRVCYGEDEACFVPVCSKCGRFVKADETIRIYGEGTVKEEEPNATCKKCGRVPMLFEGFL